MLNAIYGPDGRDGTVAALPFSWQPQQDIKKLRVGYLKNDFGKKREDESEWEAFDLRSLDVLRSLGIDLIPIELPDYPIEAMSFILSVEAAAFDDLTRSNRDDLLVRQIKNAWPNVFREARMIPAVEYVQANRMRTKVMAAMAELLSDIDVYVTPSFVGSNLLLTNLTGHPQVVLPNGFRKNGTPTSISFVGTLYGESKLLAVAKAYQDATEFHLQHPDIGA